nr:TetR/AcrR family transcriptional regulator [Bdellovibrio sp. CKG001]BFD63066.1 TetR/AcrR family transcriptional regulator [Bdellovibrio sp. HM001]
MDTRTRALDLARHYLQTLGFNGFSFQTVADALGIRKASLHYYFASKEDLGMALIEDYRTHYENWARKNASLPALEKLELLFVMFNKIASDEHKICPVGVLTADFNSLSKPLKKKILEFHLGQRAWLIRTFKEGLEQKSLRKDLDIEATAELFLSSIQGGLLMARLRNDPKVFKDLCKNLLKSITAT